MAELKKGISWSGRMHYLQDRPEPRWALCGVAPYPLDDKANLRHLGIALVEGHDIPMCKKCEKAAAKL